jgi:hypothetical protein
LRCVTSQAEGFLHIKKLTGISYILVQCKGVFEKYLMGKTQKRKNIGGVDDRVSGVL